ncbi:nucleolar protein 14 [Phtheirospermum japonicum]|uniref:Nucleolar protein 14 n=1 Tax=Phtheirospermum japonicum TaxID=374723 RepID=A0A830BI76_9LAMI|nr:nucleolar protein 14 [Phtheirospermum japonicum]
MAKKSSTDSSKKKKSKNKIKNKLSILNSEAKKNKAPKENLFESIWSRRKFNILGKKRKDEERRRIGLSRSLAIQKRQRTLQKEYEQSSKSSVFVDKRIGEQTEGLEEFDKAIMRSQRERQLKLKKESKYNLSDGEEDDFDYQDNGYFPERDDFEEEVPLDEDEAAQWSERKLNFGQPESHEAEDGLGSRSMEGEENRHKSKKEVMEDIIFKSKFFKAQKAKEKEENEQFIDQLDKDFTSLVQSEALLSLTQPNKMKALKSLVNSSMSNDNAKKVETHIAQNKVPIQQEKPDHYDKLVGEMALDMRARPSDRTRTPEELAQDEKERLEHLELPYTIEAPKNFEEFSALVENRSDDQILEAIRRIRTFNAISIAAENRKKIQVFYGVLLQFFAVLANKKPLNFNLLNMLVKPLMEMSTEIPYFAAICARQRLLRTRAQFCEDVKNTGKSCWPSLKTLFLLRLWSMIFPCSDFRHPVMTPAILLMSEYLMRCPIVSGRDVAIGSFLCSMVLSVSSQSQKFCPEALTFIQTMLMAALNNKQKFEASQLYHLMELKTLRPLLRIEERVDGINSLDFLKIMDLPDESPYFTSDNFRASIIFAIIGNLKGFINIYKGFKSFPEIFLPISKVLHGLAEDNLIPDALKAEIKNIAEQIENKSEEYHLLRQPLRYRKKKIIKTIIPKFEENFVKGRDYDPDRERAERKKLKKKLKQEAKGAMRELRKDNYFLSEVKERDKARMEEEKAEKLGKVRAFLQEQEHAFKSGQLGKGKGKKRRR